MRPKPKRMKKLFLPKRKAKRRYPASANKLLSIMHERGTGCYLCGKAQQQSHHVVYGRGRRELSDKYGLIVYMCSECHASIHSGKLRDADLGLKAEAQKRFEAKYPNLSFLKTFGRNYAE